VELTKTRLSKPNLDLAKMVLKYRLLQRGDTKCLPKAVPSPGMYIGSSVG
jgi:hypothetical protein